MGRDKEKLLEWKRNHYKQNKQKYQEKYKKYYATPKGRAAHQISNYKRQDINNGFGEVIDFDAQWIVENIYCKPCAHCGESDWHKIGCNRLDNTKGHTKDNVEPCCKKCNDKLGLEYQWKK